MHVLIPLLQILFNFFVEYIDVYVVTDITIFFIFQLTNRFWTAFDKDVNESSQKGDKNMQTILLTSERFFSFLFI